MVPGRFDAVSLPTHPAAPRNLFWPAKDPGSVRAYALDCTAWLADVGTTILLAVVTADASLEAGSVECDGRIVRLRVWGGVAGTQPVVALSLLLVNGCRENVSVAVPVQAIAAPIQGRAATVGPADPARGGVASASYAETVFGDGIRSAFEVTHGLGTQDVNVVARDPLDDFARVPQVDDLTPTPDTARVVLGAPLANGVPLRIIVFRR